MKTFILVTAALTFIANARAGSSMKVEGNCSGTLDDGTHVDYTYYSDFDGCHNASSAAVNFNSGIEGLITGKRNFKGNSDQYQFEGYQLDFANSTGNTSGKLVYQNENGESKTVSVQCEVRDYEYADC